MKLKELLNKLEKYYSEKDEYSLKTIVNLYETLPEFKYNKYFLKNFYIETKEFKKVILTTKRLIDDFKKYLELKIIIVDNCDEMDNVCGKFSFNKDSGVITLIVTYDLLEKIKDILIENGYTDRKGFYDKLEKQPLSLLLLFFSKIQERYISYINLLNKSLSKKEIEKIREIFKEEISQAERNEENDNTNNLSSAEEEAVRIIENFLKKFNLVN